MPRFKSRVDGLKRRKGAYGCMVCGTVYKSREEALLGCGHGAETYLASKAETERFKTLHMLYRVGEITKLECQPKYDFVVNGQKVGGYRADFRYTNNRGQEVVEDVKSWGSDDGLSRLKRKLTAALYGVDVKII